MASDYGVNFGFRRSDESMAIREGRFKTPTGAPGAIQLGSWVEIDPASAGYLKKSAANPKYLPGFSGLLVQEEAMIFSAYEAQERDSYERGTSKADTLSVIWGGAGTKVWFRNTGAQTRADGRSIAAVTMATLTAVVVGDHLGWDGSKYVESDGTTIPHLMIVTFVDVSGGYVEAVLG